jgi:hypothetical protein
LNILELLHDPAQDLLELASCVRGARPAPLRCDSFVARSAMQKAIRRGLPQIALRAAATVMLTNSAVVWRRLLVTALEDLGIHETSLLVRIAAAVERRRFGIKLQDEWPLIERLILECCSATRCQAANDLHNLALNHPRYEQFRASTEDLMLRDLMAIAGDGGRDLIERNIAVLSCLGADHAPWSLRRLIAEPEVLAAAICPPAHQSARTVYAWAFRRARLPLATSSLLLIAANGFPVTKPPAFDDALPPLRLIKGVPSFALDQYTRVGRAAIRDFVSASEKWRAFAGRLRLSRGQQCRAAGELLFRAEGAVVTRRSSWDIARVLYQQSSTVGCHLPMEAVEEGQAIVLTELELLEDLRAARLS